MKTFENILEELLQARDNNPTANLNDLFEEKAKELGLSDYQKILETIGETGTLIEDFCKSSASLQEAKINGITRDEWLSTEMAKATEPCDEDVKKQIFIALEKGLESIGEE